MSEHFTPGNDNFTNNYNLDPHEVERAYYDLGAELPSRDIPEETFIEWEAGLEAHKLTSEQQMTQAWIYLEHAFGISQRGGNIDPDEQQRLDDYMAKACETFVDLSERVSVKREIRTRAEFIASQIPALQAIVSADIEGLKQNLVSAYEGQLKMGKELLQRYRRFKNVSDVPVMHALVVELLFFSKPTENFFTFPAPPRATNPRDTNEDAWSLFVFDVGDHKGIYRARVAATSPKGFLAIPPVLLRNDGYPTKQGQGLLQAFIDDDEAHKIPLVYTNSRRGSIHAAHRFIGETRAGVVEHMNQSMQLKRREFQDTDAEDIPDDPLLVYLDIPAARHPSLIPGEILDILISHYEVAYQAEALGPEEGGVLGWMHLESGFREVVTQTESVGLYGAFERAEDIFGETATTLLEREDYGLGYEMLIAKSSAQLYRALAEAEREGGDIEEVKGVYVAELIDLSVEILEKLQDVQDDETTAQLKGVLNLLTASLAATTGTHGGYVATLCTLRQRGLTPKNNQGWCINVWPLTSNGYRSNYYGRVRIAPEADESSLNHGIITVPEAAANDEDFSTLRHIIDVVDERETTPPANYGRLIAAITRAAEIAEW